MALEASLNHAVLRDTRSNRTFAQCLGHVAETIERQFQAFDNLGGNFIRRRRQIGIVERVILDPEDIEIDLVAGQQGFQREALEHPQGNDCGTSTPVVGFAISFPFSEHPTETEYVVNDIWLQQKIDDPDSEDVEP